MKDTSTQALELAGADAPEGVLPRLVTRWFFRSATVAENQPLAAGLHLITLQGPALRDVHWSAGDKLQIKLGPGLQTRTYTPIDWDPVHGRTRLLAHALAAGPGSEWVRRVRPGESISVFGPRRSLDLSGLVPQHGIVVGDETAIGLALAWRPARSLFEVDDPGVLRGVAESFGLQATLLARQPDDRHVDGLIEAMLSGSTAETRFVLAGRALTVQRLIRALRQQGVASNRILTKAYWVDGKAGLD